LSCVLDLDDPGAQSPKETWLRLLVIRAGYPRPTTQIPVLSPDRRRNYREQHRLDPARFAYDIKRSEDLEEWGRTRIRVVKKNRAADLRGRSARAWESSPRTDRKIS
jgi:hypothetical protein